MNIRIVIRNHISNVAEIRQANLGINAKQTFFSLKET